MANLVNVISSSLSTFRQYDAGVVIYEQCDQMVA